MRKGSTYPFSNKAPSNSSVSICFRSDSSHFLFSWHIKIVSASFRRKQISSNGLPKALAPATRKIWVHSFGITGSFAPGTFTGKRFAPSASTRIQSVWVLTCSHTETGKPVIFSGCFALLPAITQPLFSIWVVVVTRTFFPCLARLRASSSIQEVLPPAPTKEITWVVDSPVNSPISFTISSSFMVLL